MKNKFLSLIVGINSLIRKPIFSRISLILLGFSSTIWFLARVIPKPQRAYYPCMRAAAPLMSGFVIWLLAFSGTTLAFKKVLQRWRETRYLAASLFMVLALAATSLLLSKSASDATADTGKLEIWYKANSPLGVARGIHPGRVAWGHNEKIATWDGQTGFWWEDRFNNQAETNKLFCETLTNLTGNKNEKKAWDELFHFFNKTKRNSKDGYKAGEKITVKVNLNNTHSHENTNEINANPQLVLSLIRSLVNEAGVAPENITVTDPSRFVTNNIFDKCHTAYPKVHFVDHNGGDGREKANFVANAIPYSIDNGKVATGLATCVVEADYLINLALMKGHVSQGVTLCAKNYFGCTSIEDDWHKNAHSSGFSQNRDGSFKYLVYPDYLGHKDLGAKTMLFLIDGIYSNKFVDRVPAFKWALAPFNDNWPGSLFASQDGVAIDSVVLDFALAEWPDAPDMKFSDYYLNECALAGNPPSGTLYDPERDGTRLGSLGVTEHWNNPVDKRYSGNLKTGKGIELIYKKVN